ncbi:uncharacterized protein LOC126832659 [Patella vulgata]|uniref:uncharacterized protein LOC126832659 n=1 Tax=Patella vulgata TaxID=6465 RepID=UPI0021800FCF|nr:uncharacterized protein LOC126832659 [Patella vulgata]
MEEKIKWKEPINGFNTFFTEESYRRMVKEETFESKLLSSINALKLKSAALLEASNNEEENTQNKFQEEKDEEYYLPNKDMLTHRKAGLQQKSSLSKFEQRKYIDLFLKLRHKTYQVGQNLSNVEKKELADFEALQIRVTTEQSQFLNNLREVSNNQGVYTFLSPAGRRYFQERQHEKLKIVEELPRHYININKTLPLAIQVNIDTPPPTLQFVKTLAELGSAPKITLPTLIVNEKKMIPMEYDKIAAQYPPVHIQKVEGKFNHEVCSKDSNCEVLACKTFSHIVVCTSVLRCLVNNHAPDFSRTWEIPFTVKVHDVEYQGKIVKQKVVYFDKPLPQKNLTMRDKNTLHHKYALRAFLAKVNRKNINLPKEPLKHTMPTTCVKSKVGDNSKTSKVDDDDLFGDTCMDDVETFGGDVSPVNKSSKELTDFSQKKKCTPPKPVGPRKTSKGDNDFFSDTNIDDIETFGDSVKPENLKLRVSTRSKTKCEQTKGTKTPPEPPPSTSGSTSNKSNTLDVEELNKDLFGSESETDTRSVMGERSPIDKADTVSKGGNSDITNIKNTELIENVEKSQDKIPEIGLKSEHWKETSESQTPGVTEDDAGKNLDKKLPVDESSLSELSDIEPHTVDGREIKIGVESKIKSHIDTVSDAPMTSGCDSEMDNLIIDAPACDKPRKIVPNMDDTDSSDTDANLVIDIDESNQKILKKRKVEEIFSPNESMDENFICNPSPIRVINLTKKDRNVPNRNNSAIFKQKWRLRRLSSGGETSTPLNGNVVRLRSGRLINSDASADERSSVGTTSQSDSESVFTPPKKPRKMEEICSPDVITPDDGSEFPVKVIPLDPQEYGQIIMLKNKPKRKRCVRRSSVEKETPRILRSRNRSISTESGDNDGSDSVVSDEGSLDSVVKQRRRSARLQTSIKEETTPVINEQKSIAKNRNRKEKPEIVNVPSMEQCDIKTEELPTKRKRGRPRKKRVENCESITADVELNLIENISTDVKPDVADGQEMETMTTGTIINRHDEMQNDVPTETKPVKNSISVETNDSQGNSTLADRMSVNLKSETRKNNPLFVLDKVEEKSRMGEKVLEQNKERQPILLDKTTAKSKERKSHVMAADSEKTDKNAQISKDKTTVDIPGDQQQTQSRF